MSGDLAYVLKAVAKAIFLPPGVFVVLLLWISWTIRRKSPQRFGSWVCLTVMALALYCMSISAVVSPLVAQLENQFTPLPWSAGRPNVLAQDAKAIVVLGGGIRRGAPEYALADEPSWRSLERMRYGAQLARSLQLPMLLTGGSAPGTIGSEAGAMRRVLEQDFNIQARWVEDQSLDTADNARLSAQLLKADGIIRVFLVTHAIHMPRAVALFERQGLQVIPAPMGFLGTPGTTLEQFIPQVSILLRFYDTLHEWIGTVWIRYVR
jgi:uncharacterized SAM-binding protein YcdF (DUF218 family)